MLTIKDLTKKYGDKKALNQINLTFDRAEFVAIYGPSGSGKSTLMNIIGGLDVAYEGTVTFFDRQLKDFSKDELADYRLQSIGFVFQSFNLQKNYSTLENAMLPGRLLSSATRSQKKEAKERLKSVGINYTKKLARHLSGGEQQRIAITRALMNNPDIILADEPTGALDSVNSKNVLDILKTISSNNKTVIVVTHDDEVLKYADRIIRISDGQVTSDQRTNENKLMVPSKKKKRFAPLHTQRIAIRNFFTQIIKNTLVALAVSLTLAVILLILTVNEGIQQAATINEQRLFLDQNLLVASVTTERDDFETYTDGIESIPHVTNAYNINNLGHVFLESEYNGERIIKETSYARAFIEEKKPTLLFGDYPKNDDEILLTKESIYYLFKVSPYDESTEAEITALLGKTITVTFSNEYDRNITRIYERENGFQTSDFGIQKEYRLVGITHDYDDFYQSANDLYFAYDELMSYQNKAITTPIDGESLLEPFKRSPVFYIFTDSNEASILGDIRNQVYDMYPTLNISNDMLKYHVILAMIQRIILGFYGFILLSIVMTGLLIYVTRYISVISRTKEIGLLKAIGATNRNILKIFLNEGVMTGILSFIFALFIASENLYHLQSYLFNFLKDLGIFQHDIYHYYMVDISLQSKLIVFILAVGISLVGSLIPSIKASQLNPVEALYNE